MAGHQNRAIDVVIDERDLGIDVSSPEFRFAYAMADEQLARKDAAASRAQARARTHLRRRARRRLTLLTVALSMTAVCTVAVPMFQLPH